MTADGSPAALLADERQAALDRLAALERDFSAIVDAAGQADADDEHDPEGATLAFERQHVAALADAARDGLAEILAALARLADGSYGTCEACGRPISAERLAARPAARTCVGCVRSR